MAKNIIYSNELVGEIISIKSRKNSDLLPVYKQLSSEALRYKNIAEFYANKITNEFYIHDMISKESMEIRNAYFDTIYFSVENKVTDFLKTGLIKTIEIAQKMWRAFIEFVKKIGRAIMNFVRMVSTAIKNKLAVSQSKFYEKYKDQIFNIKTDVTVNAIKFRDDFIDQFYRVCDTMEKSSVVEILNRLGAAIKEFIDLLKKFISSSEYRNEKVTTKDKDGEITESRFMNDLGEALESNNEKAFKHFKEKFSLIDLLNEFSTFLSYADIKDTQNHKADLLAKIDESFNVKFFGQIKVPAPSEIKVKDILTEKNLLCMEKEFIDKANLLVKNLNKVTLVIGPVIGLLNTAGKLLDLLKDKSVSIIQEALAERKVDKNGNETVIKKSEEEVQNYIKWLKEFNYICTNVITGCKEYSRKSLTVALLFRNQVYQTMKKVIDKKVEYEEVTEKKEARKEAFKDLPKKVGNKIKDVFNEGANEKNQNVKMML